MSGVPAIMPDALHRPDVDVSDAQRDDSVAPEQRKRKVVKKKKKKKKNTDRTSRSGHSS